ncbi:MAG: phosphatidate cytidylyltransferase, partial [Verrucomicrobiota bacterium]
MAKRIFSTILLWVITGVAFFKFGEPAAVLLLVVLSLASQYEFYKLLERMGRHPFKAFGCTLGVIMIIGPYSVRELAEHHVRDLEAGIIAITIVACCLRILTDRKTEERIETLGSTLLGLIYIPFMLNFLVRILILPDLEIHGLMLVIWCVATAKFCDVGALLFGKAFGKHLMSPVTSPKKTWEGAIGGVLSSAFLGCALTYFFADYYPDFLTPLWGTLFAIPIAIISIISDLVESMIKRNAEQKDSGRFIPGIGGAF